MGQRSTRMLCLVVGTAGPVFLAAQIRAQHNPTDPEGCRCAQIACAYVLRALDTTFKDDDLAALAPGGSQVISLDTLAAALRTKGVVTEVCQLSPVALQKVRDPVIVCLRLAKDHEHFETFVGASRTQGYFVTPETYSQARLVVRSFDDFPRTWDGRALIAWRRDSTANTVLHSPWAHKVLVFVVGFVGGWLGLSLIHKRRGPRAQPAPAA